MTDSIAHKIATICEYLYTNTASKKHGGYLIYSDDKIKLDLDTYVPNTTAIVILPKGETEHVFTASYTGYIQTYHGGKWEDYLNELYEKALIVKEQRDEEKELKKIAEENKRNAHASEMADKVFEK